MYTGSDLDPAKDKDRLDKQMGRIYELMIDGKWRTLKEIENATGYWTSSISAQLRNLKKPEYGRYIVDHRPRGDRRRFLCLISKSTLKAQRYTSSWKTANSICLKTRGE